MELDFQLRMEVASGNMRGVDRLLAAGAYINGFADSRTRPLLLAAEMGRIEVLELLVGRGADLEVASFRETLNDFGVAVIPKGSRALHAAVIGGKVESVRFLLKAGANPDVIDSRDMSPLMLAFDSAPLVTELLRGGASPSFSNDDGMTALHMSAFHGGPQDVMDLLLEAAPSTLNQISEDGSTPLAYAAEEGHETLVSCLLAKGASDDALWYPGGGLCALWRAVESSHEEVVRRLVDGGLGVTGGDPMRVLSAMCRASERRLPRILRILLLVEGEARSTYWARQFMGNLSILHHAALYGCLGTVHVALEAGADENLVNSQGARPSDSIGMYTPQGTENPEKLKAAIGRMLERGPAFRARSWAWPRMVDAACAGHTTATTPRPSGGKHEAPPQVRTFRPRCKRCFTTRFARYVLK